MIVYINTWQRLHITAEQNLTYIRQWLINHLTNKTQKADMDQAKVNTKIKKNRT